METLSGNVPERASQPSSLTNACNNVSPKHMQPHDDGGTANLFSHCGAGNICRL